MTPPSDHPYTPDLDSEFGDLAGLAAELRALRPETPVAFAQGLDRRVAAGFPKQRRDHVDSPVRRILAPAVSFALVAAFALFMVTSSDFSFNSGDSADSGEMTTMNASEEASTTESAARTADEPLAVEDSSLTNDSGGRHEEEESADSERTSGQHLSSDGAMGEKPGGAAAGIDWAGSETEEAEAAPASGGYGSGGGQSEDGPRGATLALVLIGLGVVLLVPVAWITVRTLRQRRREQALDW